MNVTLTWSGEVDMGCVSDLWRDVEQAVEQGATSITFDLAAVTFMDSRAIGVLVNTYRSVGAVELVNAPTHIAHLLEVSGVYTIIGG